MNEPATRVAATERYLAWGRLGAGASLLASLQADVLYGYGWFEGLIAGGGLSLILAGLLALLGPRTLRLRQRLAGVLRWWDTAILGLMVAGGPDEDAGYVLVLGTLMLMLAALRGMRAYRVALGVAVAAEVVRQALRPLLDRSIDPLDSLIGLGVAVAISVALARMVEMVRESEDQARRSADAATRALAEARRAADQVDVLHRVVASTIGASEAAALQTIVAEIASYLHVPAATVFLLDEDARPRVSATTDPDVASRDDVTPVTRGPFLHGPLGRALAGEVARASGRELAAMVAAGHPHHGDVTVHPLRRAGGEVVGALACGTPPERTFSTTEVHTIGRFADQMSVAIEAARSLHREADLAARYRELDRLKTDFVAITSHELRTPLTTVVGVIETMRQRLDDLTPDETARLVEALGRQAQRLSRLVDDLGTVSRVDAGTLTTVPRSVDVAAIVEDVVVGLPDIHVVTHVDTDVRPRATADPDRLQQVVTNLVVNGDQHGEGPVHVAVDRDRAEVTVRVWDEGPGIPADRRHEVFERFVRLGDTDSHSRGSGLGLAIARELTVAMGGELDVVDLGPHTCFEVRLPALADAVPGVELAPR